MNTAVTMYLNRDAGVALLRRVVERFPSGELQFDVFNRLGIRLQNINPVVRRSGSTLHWAINGPNEILRRVPGTRLFISMSVFDADAFRQVPRRYRLMARIMSLTPQTKNIAQFHRYAF